MSYLQKASHQHGAKVQVYQSGLVVGYFFIPIADSDAGFVSISLSSLHFIMVQRLWRETHHTGSKLFIWSY